MSSDESLLARLRHRYHDATTPTNVERAPSRERWKRQAWMVGSTLLSLTVTIGPLAVAVELGGPTYEPLALATLAYAVVVFVLIDRRLFQWGLDRFDLTLPWQFREAEYESLDDDRVEELHRQNLTGYELPISDGVDVDYMIRRGHVYRVDRDNHNRKRYLRSVDEIPLDYWRRWDDAE